MQRQIQDVRVSKGGRSNIPTSSKFQPSIVYQDNQRPSSNRQQYSQRPNIINNSQQIVKHNQQTVIQPVSSKFQVKQSSSNKNFESSSQQSPFQSSSNNHVQNKQFSSNYPSKNSFQSNKNNSQNSQPTWSRLQSVPNAVKSSMTQQSSQTFTGQQNNSFQQNQNQYKNTQYTQQQSPFLGSSQNNVFNQQQQVSPFQQQGFSQSQSLFQSQSQSTISPFSNQHSTNQPAMAPMASYPFGSGNVSNLQSQQSPFMSNNSFTATNSLYNTNGVKAKSVSAAVTDFSNLGSVKPVDIDLDEEPVKTELSNNVTNSGDIDKSLHKSRTEILAKYIHPTFEEFDAVDENLLEQNSKPWNEKFQLGYIPTYLP